MRLTSEQTQLDALAVFSAFPVISLEEIEGLKLLNRTDTKFILPMSEVKEVFNQLPASYCVLEVVSTILQTYETLYFDTDDYKSYSEHQAGFLNRIKIRRRKYMDTDSVFWEVKLKNNHRKTEKFRLPGSGDSLEIPEICLDFAEKNARYPVKKMAPSLWVRFQRIILASYEFQERVTVDLNLGFQVYPDGKMTQLSDLVVLELKQPLNAKASPLFHNLRQRHHLSSSMSKYCVGMVFSHPELKANAFKPLLRNISSITNPESIQ